MAKTDTATGRSRWISGAEFLVGAAVVLGQNVWRVLPNEVPILFAAGIVSTRLLRERSWSALGFGRPTSWRRVVVIGVAAAALRVALGELVIQPLTALFLPPDHTSAKFHAAMTGALCAG